MRRWREQSRHAAPTTKGAAADGSGSSCPVADTKAAAQPATSTPETQLKMAFNAVEDGLSRGVRVRVYWCFRRDPRRFVGGAKQLKMAFHVVFGIAASNANWPLTSLLPRRRRPSHPSPLPCNPWPLASGDATERVRAAESQALIGKVFTREKSIPNKLWASHSS